MQPIKFYETDIQKSIIKHFSDFSSNGGINGGFV